LDYLFVIAAAIGVIAVCALTTIVVVRASLTNPWISKLPFNILVAFSFLAVVSSTVVAVLAFRRGLRDARRRTRGH
jgi:hypothetical protein